MPRDYRIDEEMRRLVGGEKEEGRSLDLSALPEGCVAAVISLTTPADAGRLAVVSTMFKSAAESDAVWERFLPHDYKSLLPQSLCTTAESKKQLYLTLCDRPVLIDQGRKSFSLEKCCGKKCYMISARDLVIIWSDTPRYWNWVSLPDARFPEVAELINVCWLEIRGKISTKLLSPTTYYKAYLVFKTTVAARGLDFHPAEAAVCLDGTKPKKQTVYLDSPPRTSRTQQHYHIPRRFSRISRYIGSIVQAPQPAQGQEAMSTALPKPRSDGWLEIELGEFFNDGMKDNGEVEMSVLEVRSGNWKSGLIVQGIEIRPNRCGVNNDMLIKAEVERTESYDVIA